MSFFQAKLSRCTARCLCAAISTLIAATANAGAPAPRYVVTEIPTLGGTSSAAYDINNKSQVVGSSKTGDFAPPPWEMMPIERGFVWQNGVMTALPPLPAPEPYHGAAMAISDAGHIVGTSSFFMFFGSRAVIWHNGAVTDMGVVPGTDHCQGNSVNDNGVVAGSCMSDFGGSGYAFRWSQSDGQDVIMEPLQNEDAQGNGIDAQGKIVGGHGESVGAFMWNNGAVTPLINGPFGASAMAINDQNQIVGWNSAPGFILSAFRWSNGSSIPLGTLGGNSSRAQDINNNGWIVGSSNISPGVEHAFVWIDGTMHDLHDLIPESSGWFLGVAEAINDKNQIVGNGTNPQGQPRGFLLTPVGPGDVNGDGTVNVADLLALINSWGPCPAQGDCFADFDNNGVVNVADLLVLIENWG